MKLSRLLVIILPLLIWLLSQAYLVWPEFFYLSVAISSFFLLFVSFYLKQVGPKVSWWFLAILPLMFLLLISVYISFSTNFWLIQLLMFTLLFFQYNYFKGLYYFWNKPELYKSEDMRTVKAYGSFLIIFFAASNVYGLQSLLNFTVWPMVIAFAVAMFSVAYLNIKSEDLQSKTVWHFSILHMLIMTEMTLVMAFLPLNYNISGLSVAIIYYLSANLINLYLQKALTPKKIKLYIILSFSGLTALLFTANWLN